MDRAEGEQKQRRANDSKIDTEFILSSSTCKKMNACNVKKIMVWRR